MAYSSTLRQRFQVWLSGDADDQILRWMFRGMVAATLTVLAVDLAAMNGLLKSVDSALTPSIVPRDGSLDTASPSLMPAILAPLLPGGDRRLAPMPQSDGVMAKPMTFELVGGGRLLATGTITPGIAETFAAEISKRGDYIKTVVLNSPGGAVGDALAIGKLIRERKIATEVEAGKYCASSCPLVLFGGVERRVGDKAMIGVHQVSALGAADPVAQRDGMSDAQRISARCQRYLGEMGVNLQVWVHAMETPRDKLFIFKPDELKALGIVTETAPLAATASSAGSTRPR